MENKFSVNDSAVQQQVEVSKEMVDANELKEQVPTVHLDDVHMYKTTVSSLGQELKKLIEEGFMTEAVAERLINDFMYTAFNQLVKVNLR